MRRAVVWFLVLAATLVGTAPELHGRQSAMEFWGSLGDPVLERLISRALDDNLDLHAMEARVRRARAAHLEAGLDLIPSVTARAGYTRQRLPAVVMGPEGGLGDHDIWDTGVQLFWELDVFGGGRRTREARSALLDSAEEDVLDMEVLVAAWVAAAYFDLRGAQDRLAVARRNAENQRRTLDVTLDRLDAGQGNALDSERARALLSATLAEIPALEGAIATAEHRIEALLGQRPGALSDVLGGGEVSPAWPPPPTEVPDGEALVRLRPDLRSAERRVAAAEASVSARRSGYLPRISIGGAAGYSSHTPGALGDSGTGGYAIGPVVSWPLFDLGRVRAGVEAARADRTEALARFRRATVDALEEVESSITRYGMARERIRHLEDAAAASERATELARIRFEEGGTGFLEVLDTERTQLEAQDRLAAGRTEAMRELVAVYRALGGRWAPGDGR